jgi:2-polyprenyl-6-methoxyphenol hydroxylase-like FAD-dependent oxidoreductase
MPHTIVVGAGPAGASLAYLLARRGIEVTLIERQRDFAREFRGEVLLPSGVDALHQMGLGAVLDGVPHAALDSLTVYMNRRTIADVELDPAFFGGADPLAVSQPALLEAIVAEAAKSPSFRLLRGCSVRDLVRTGERVTGVRLAEHDGEREIAADFVVGTDGRASIVRKRGGLDSTEQAPPMDIVWCKLPLPPGFRGGRGYLGKGHLLLAYRTWGEQLQVAWAILKGTFGDLRRRGISEWIEEMGDHVTPDLAAHLRANAAAIAHPFLLDAVSDRVLRWTLPGALVLGDAAHTMSPVGGQGLNVALRDAIVAANHLVPVLLAGGDASALDAAAQRIEAERLPEIVSVQRAQALPPRIALSHAWWGEPVRRLLALAVRSGLATRVAVGQAQLFAFGAKPVRLEV